MAPEDRRLIDRAVAETRTDLTEFVVSTSRPLRIAYWQIGPRSYLMLGHTSVGKLSTMSQRVTCPDWLHYSVARRPSSTSERCCRIRPKLRIDPAVGLSHRPRIGCYPFAGGKELGPFREAGHSVHRARL